MHHGVTKLWAQDMQAGKQKSGILLRTVGREASSIITKSTACYRVRWIHQIINYSLKISFFVSSTERCRNAIKSCRAACENQCQVPILSCSHGVMRRGTLTQRWNNISLWLEWQTLSVLIIPNIGKEIEKRSTNTYDWECKLENVFFMFK